MQKKKNNFNFKYQLISFKRKTKKKKYKKNLNAIFKNSHFRLNTKHTYHTLVHISMYVWIYVHKLMIAWVSNIFEFFFVVMKRFLLCFLNTWACDILWLFFFFFDCHFKISKPGYKDNERLSILSCDYAYVLSLLF